MTRSQFNSRVTLVCGFGYICFALQEINFSHHGYKNTAIFSCSLQNVCDVDTIVMRISMLNPGINKGTYMGTKYPIRRVCIV